MGFNPVGIECLNNKLLIMKCSSIKTARLIEHDPLVFSTSL